MTIAEVPMKAMTPVWCASLVDLLAGDDPAPAHPRWSSTSSRSGNTVGVTARLTHITPNHRQSEPTIAAILPLHAPASPERSQQFP
ncbi:MAG: hypothetical protein ACRCU1_09725 [Alsobacter sp.]